MRYSISETAKLTGVSVRTLHYYDEIGLLPPSEVNSDTNYRYYDEESINTLQQILFFKELDFPLKEIMKIMNSTNYNKEEALIKQRKLLMIKKERLEKLINLLDSNIKGDANMSFKEFDDSKLTNEKEKYAKEIKEKYGNTEAYKEYDEKKKKYSKDDFNTINDKLFDLVKDFSLLINEDPKSEKVQSLVKVWQDFITKYYYNCTKEILYGLGQMYIADERFTKNMDKYAKGTAKLISDAIKYYCKGE